ncbi:hypothetical protein ED407_02855 [Listeria monocytogenes]|nr:hypothetical protein [Listeria monocytogenes]EAD5322720.1 hypothetical protein [Listeria monocytogenes]
MDVKGRMEMKKLVLVFGVLLLSLGLAACGSNNSSKTSKSGEAKNPDAFAYLEMDKKIYKTDKDGYIWLSGEADSKAEIDILHNDTSIDTITADKNGIFKYKEKIGENTTRGITATNSMGKESTVSVKVKLSKEAEENYKMTQKQKEEKAIKDAEKRAIKEKKEQQESESEAKENSKDISFQMLDKNADNYINEPYYIKGEVVQAIEDGGETLLRVNITKDEYGDYDNTVAVLYDDVTDAVEDDIIEVYGKIYGKYKYESTIGAKLTVPGIQADSIKVLK